MTKKRTFCLLFVLLGFSLLAKLPAEQWYRVSETELLKLEAISRNSETDRQNWLSQATELKVKVQTLQTESKRLNGQLEKEREVTKNLRKSFELSEAAQFQRASDYETEIASLKESLSNTEKDTLKIKNQRNVLFFILLGISGILGTFFYLKIRNPLK